MTVTAKPSQKPASKSARTAPGEKPSLEATPLTEAIELLFFAYRDFISEPDRILVEYDFGRAHHRVVHFVGRHPGITVAELLNILRITKQSLARVLKQLIERGFIEQETGKQDRRQRLLYLTKAGLELEERLAAPQRARVAAALEKAGPQAATAWRTVLLALVNENDRPEVERLIAANPKRQN
jgi:DNA-binding MarR family transcriptional regulator